MKSYAVHYKNKYPKGRVEFTEDKLDAYCSRGIHRVALRKDGGGAIVDKSKELGALDKHDLSPIPKNTRVFKLNADGSIGLDEQCQERAQVSSVAADQGKILSIDEYAKKGHAVDEKGSLVIKAASQASEDTQV